MGSFLKEHIPEATVLGACAAITIWLVFYAGYNNHAETAMFVVTSITLAVLISYARDTNRMARVASAKWERESRPRGRYSIGMVALVKEPYSDRVLFELINPSDLILKAKV